MISLQRLCLVFASFICVMASAGRSGANPIERAAIADHQDQIQNLTIECQETRKYDTDLSGVGNTSSPMSSQFDAVWSETSSLKFSFLNGNARFERTTDPATLKYWASKKLPAIVSQIQTISADGRIEELTTQQLTNGKRPSFGGFRQLNQFSPEDTIDLALGLRLLGARQWLTKDDLTAMREVPQSDQSIICLIAKDGAGHTHELHFDRRLLFALVYYRCSTAHGASVEITNSDFHRYDGVFLPGKIVRVSNIPVDNGPVRHPLVFTYIVDGASVNDANNNVNNYIITFPAHLLLFDARTSDQVEVGPIARTLSDDDIHRQIVERQLHQEIYEGLAERRIGQALASQPSTRPSN